MKRILAAILVLTAIPDAVAQMPVGTPVTVQGSFCSRQNGAPVPGLTVSLVHPVIGRSVPAYTDQFGNFVLYNVPVRPDQYYIEVYWGPNLIMRDRIFVSGPLRLPPRCI